MNILTDNHHPSLTYSLELLLGKRLGHKLMYPIGFEWYERGFFRYFSNFTPVKHHLDIGRADPKVRQQNEVLTGSGVETVDPGLHYCYDVTKDIYERAVTFEEFLKRPIDAVIASVPEHVEPFDRLIRRHKPGAKLIFQMGNLFDYFDLKGVWNVLNSTDRSIPPQIHSVQYNQEFDLGHFYFTKSIRSKQIVSFINYWRNFNEDPEFHKEVMKGLKGFRFYCFGSDNEDGVVTKTAEVARHVREADFVWHVKKGGDGYGHVVHNAASCGRPVILSKKTYGSLRFGKFIEDGQTCVDADGLSAEELAKKILYYSEPGRYERMCREIYERFRRFVDFDEDANKVGVFLENLKPL